MNIPFMKRNVPQLTGPVDLDEEMRLTVADRLPQAPQLPVSNFAPRLPVKRVESFMALSRKEVDDAMATLTIQYEAAKARGQRILDLIALAEEEHLANLERERAFAEFTKEAFDTLERKYDGLHKPTAEPDAPKQIEEPAATEHDQTDGRLTAKATEPV
jgi:hypothetical protein